MSNMSDNIELTKDYIHVMFCYTKGKTIEKNQWPSSNYPHLRRGPYKVDDNPEWNWEEYDYRVKEEKEILDDERTFFINSPEDLKELREKVDAFLGLEPPVTVEADLDLYNSPCNWRIVDTLAGEVISEGYADLRHLIRDNF